jgi:putative transposase
MGYKKPTFITGEIYHVYNRGVEKRAVFSETSDYLRMVDDIYKLNDKNNVINPHYCQKRNPARLEESVEREILVEMLAFVLMPNHYHLVLRQVEENGIVKFMQKLGTGYTNYFNKKNERVGPLFQGSFKATRVATDDYLQNLLGYVHTNPVTLAHNYRSSTSIIIMDFLEKYRWSSFLDYVGIENFPAVTSRDFVFEVMGGAGGIKESTEAWIANREEKRETVPEIIDVELR